MNIKYAVITLGSFALLALPACVVPTNATGTYSAGLNTSLRALPYGYRTIRVGNSPFYFSGNNWYRPYNGRYIRTSRPSNYHGSIGRKKSRSSNVRSYARPTTKHNNYQHSTRTYQANPNTADSPRTRTTRNVRSTNTRSTDTRSSNVSSSDTRSSIFDRLRSRD